MYRALAPSARHICPNHDAARASSVALLLLLLAARLSTAETERTAAGASVTTGAERVMSGGACSVDLEVGERVSVGDGGKWEASRACLRWKEMRSRLCVWGEGRGE
jgi:hypothetical protein